MNTKEIQSRVLAKADSPYVFTLDPATGELVIPFGVPSGTELKYVERRHYADGTSEDSDWITHVIR